MGKKINEMSLEEFKALPIRESFACDVGEFDSLVILPSLELHDSGYRLMDFVACREGEPFIRLSGCSDALHIGGIGSEKKNSWTMDCLPTSGLLRLFKLGGANLKAGAALSNFEVF